MGEVRVRGYREHDRAAVRRICFETGYMGDSVAWQWADRESFADLFTGWYTDHEPESALVAEADGEVVGYLLGCRDSRSVRSPASVGGWRMMRRGVLIRPGTAPVLWRSLGDIVGAALHGHGPPTGFHDDRWLAHLHIDLLPHARSRGLGGALMTRWLDDLAAADISGCHLETWAENGAAIAFFERQGFVRWGDPELMPGLRTPDGRRHHTQVMVQSLRPRRPTPASTDAGVELASSATPSHGRRPVEGARP